MLLLYTVRQGGVNGGQSLRGFPAAATSLDLILRNLAMAEDIYLGWRTSFVAGWRSEKAVRQGSAENT